MSFCVTDNDKFRYFIYKGAAYGNGTKVVLKNNFINNYTYNGKRIWKYAWFGNRVNVNGKNLYFFHIDNIDWLTLHKNNIDPRLPRQCCPFFLISEELIEIAIENIIYQVSVVLIDKRQMKDYESNDVMFGWLMYIVIMIGSLIFKEFYLIWGVASIVFFSWRKEKLNQ